MERPLAIATGVRAALAVPIYAGGRVIGTFSVGSFTPGVYSDEHVAACRQIADLIGPFVQSVVLFLRERRRRARLNAVAALGSILGASLKVGDLLERFGDALRPVVDFDAMAILMVKADRGAVEVVEVLDLDKGHYAESVALDDYSMFDRLAPGEIVLIHNAEREFDRSRPGDARILAQGRRSVLVVPLRFGDQISGYAYFAKRQPGWYEDADVEVGQAVAAVLVIAVQHQRSRRRAEARRRRRGESAAFASACRVAPHRPRRPLRLFTYHGGRAGVPRGAPAGTKGRTQ